MLKKINNKIGNTLLIAFIFVFISLLFTNKVYAADLSLSPSSGTVSVGNIVSIKVNVNTTGKIINNAEATILFPVDMLEVVSITKNSSIFSLWVEEPSFSNTTGKVTFNGGVPNPGYIGANGYIATITFKAKKQGTASVIFTDGAVRENDGLGTDILNTKNGSVIQIGVPQVVPIPVPVTLNEKSTVPAKPVISSDTHPDQDTWYQSNTANFSWKIPNGVTRIQTLINKDPNGTPSINYDNSVTQKTLNNLSEGVYYFHLRYFNAVGASPIAHYKVKIDGTSPKQFTPTIRAMDDNNLIKLDGNDDLSGIDYYELRIDNNKNLKVKIDELRDKEYLLPILNEGTHEVVVAAYDKAGNKTEANVSYLNNPISIPEISLNLDKITIGETVIILGKTKYPNKKVSVILESEGKEIKKYIQNISTDGSFSVTTESIKTKGLISIWAEVIISDDVKSAPSEKVYLKVNETEVVKVTLAIFYPLLGLIAIIVVVTIFIFLLYLGWHKFFGLRRKMHKELENTKDEVHKAMLLLKEELSSQLEALENIKQDRALNKKEEAIFKEIQKNVDSIDNFVENKLKKII